MKAKGWEDFPLLQMPKLEGRAGVVASSMPLESYEQALRKYALVLQPLLEREENDPVALFTAKKSSGHFQYLTGTRIVQLHFDEHFNRVTLVIAKGAEITLDITIADPSTISARTIELILEERACCRATVRGQSSSWSFTALRAQCKTASQLIVKSFCPGIRLDAHVQLIGERAQCHLFGLAKLAGREQCHTHVLMEHKAPHTLSKQLFKHVLKDSSRASFSGKIFVASNALKTDAFQRSANLLLGQEAHATCRPNLEIFADDVKASHGATIGQLDAAQLFYLQSRGVPKETSERFLIDAFCAEVL